MDKKKVTIFGAGIAGLTAAHELAIRGFNVTVYDPVINENVTLGTSDRGVGGMARSQFVVDQTQADLAQLPPATDYLLDASLTFRVKDGEPICDEYPPGTLNRYVELWRNNEGKTVPRLALHVSTNAFDRANLDSDLRFKFLSRLLLKEAAIQPDDLRKTIVTPQGNPNTATFILRVPVMPAEHGFRFFPSFYRHLFDTMRRTPILNPGSYEVASRSVYDNLVPVDRLGFARGGKAESFVLPRRPPRSFEEVRANLEKVLSELEWTSEDLERFTLKMFQYMTSCPARREREYEGMSWADFAGLASYSPIMQEHLEYGPQMMASLRGSASDARTQGTIVVQLFLDYLREGARPDSTLAGPTSGLWLNHWHDYLLKQGVTFKRGAIDRIETRDGVPTPVLQGGTCITDGYVVFALPYQPMLDLARAVKRDAASTGWDDLDMLVNFGKQRECDPSPIRDMSGIQFYFDTEVDFWGGHTQYLDSEWGLTSISQAQFWYRRREPQDAFRSILSVDIGIWDRPARGLGRSASQCTATEIAQEVWRQVKDHHDDAFRAEYGSDATFPHPVAFALDQGLKIGAQGLERNNFGFLVNAVGKYRLRPGKLARGSAKGAAHYDIGFGRFVMAGTHMQTFTRITSMESANESARHAVNAILRHAKAACDRCAIWDPEDLELDELKWLRELDEELLRRGRPHLVKIMGWGELPPLWSAELGPFIRRAVQNG